MSVRVPDFARLADIDALTGGDVIGDVNRFSEVTARQTAEAALRESEKGLSQLLHGLPAAVYTTDAAGRITFYNEAAAALWGCRPELGRSEFCGSWKLYRADGTPLPHEECPMALALKEKRAIRGMEAIAERPDGTRVPFIPYPTPLFDAAGALTGAVNMLVDITERKQAEEAQQQLAAIVASSNDAIVSKDLNGIIITWNSGAERLFGYSAEEVVGKPITIVFPADRINEEEKLLASIRRGERVESFETVRRRKDGSLVDISLTLSPVKDSHGRIVGASKIARDITERKRAQEQQGLLLREMSHRVKNLFAVTSGVIALSARSASTAGDLASAVQDRLAALTRAHELTRPGLIEAGGLAGRDATLHAVVRTILAPYDGSGFRLTGSDLPIAADAVTNIALVLHELATNAAKYGALSSPGGVIHIDCSANENELLLAWKERGGPVIEREPGQEGFGGVLTRRIVSGHFGGRISRQWERDGLAVHLSLPLERLKT
jgi:PAS domain S-box-containing protein